ncbi:hypothetical protein F5X99DRAFT_383830 [Biscogniauxia marginata]|nr:hypothetical protein F5X99DRAFT_383830 [Biscogniauxia marginata]
MSTATMTMTVPPSKVPAESSIMSATTTTTSACCPNCGLSLPPDFTDSHAALLQAQKQIEDLQAQVRLLNQKAAAAVDRWADYEDELSRLRAASTTSAATTATTNNTSSTTNNNSNNLSSGYNNRPQTPNPTPSAPASSPRSSFLPAGAASRISQLLSPRRSANNNNNNNTLTAQSQSLASLSSPQLPLPNGGNHHQHHHHHHHHRANSSQSRGTSPSPTPSADDLLEALTREKELRAAAEGRLHDTSKEVEELSVTLFEQANEMVAAERRARAELEARVSVLERRDREKRDRLDRLEGAMDRIQRVRALLGEK